MALPGANELTKIINILFLNTTSCNILLIFCTYIDIILLHRMNQNIAFWLIYLKVV